MAKIGASVSGKLFRACAECVSKEETRYYLNGVYIQPHPAGGATLVATDGHRMLVAYDPDGSCDAPVIASLNKEAAAFLTKALKADELAKVDVGADGTLSFGVYRGDKSAVIDGTYPDWARVLGPILKGAKARFHGKQLFSIASFNGAYVGSFGKIANILTPSRGGSAPIRLVAFGEGDPAMFLFPDTANVFGVLMPMRTNQPESALPFFMKDILEPKPGAKAAKTAQKKLETASKRKAA